MGASRFNAKPKNGVAFLEENRLIYADLSLEITKPRSLATFLKNCTRLDKRLLGDYISKPDNIEVLKAFIGLFDFKDVSSAYYCFFIVLLANPGGPGPETNGRGYAGTSRDVPPSWGSAANLAYHRNLRSDLLCF